MTDYLDKWDKFLYEDLPKMQAWADELIREYEKEFMSLKDNINREWSW